MNNSSKNFIFFIKRIPGYFLWLNSFLFIRSTKKWCFGSQTGFLGSNPAYLLIDILLNHPNISVAWITNDCETFSLLLRNGIPVYKKWSLRGVWFCLTSKVYVYSHGVGDVNFSTSGNTFKVNLWHGIGFKNIEYLAQLKWINKRNIYHRIIYPFYCVNHNLILSSSDYISRWLKDCFRCSEEIMIYNYPPRCKTRLWSLDKTQNYISKFNTQLLPYVELTKIHTRAFLYMPTYRENNNLSVIEASGFDLSLINEILKDNNDIMFIKFHPRDLKKIKSFPSFTNVIIIKDNIDPYLFFPFITVLITDYSSVYAEYMLYNNSSIIFDYDKEEYEKKENGCYYEIDDFIKSKHARSFEELLRMIKYDKDYLIPEFHDVYKKLWGKCGEKDIVEQITARIKK